MQRLARVPRPVPGQQCRSRWGRGRADNGGYSWRAVGGIWLLGKGRGSQELAMAAVQGLPAHPSPGSIVPGWHPRPLAMG